MGVFQGFFTKGLAEFVLNSSRTIKFKTSMTGSDNFYAGLCTVL